MLQDFLFLSSSFTMATRVILLYELENIIWLSEATVGCWAHRLIGRESRRESWGRWIPLGRASTPLTYLDHSDGPLLQSPRVLRWMFLTFRVHPLTEVCSRCLLHIIVSNGPWWDLPWCIHLLEICLQPMIFLSIKNESFSQSSL